MKVLGFWPDDSLWYPGVVVSLDYVHRTVHIRYDDNDEDTAVPWYKARILEDELGDGWHEHMFLVFKLGHVK